MQTIYVDVLIVLNVYVNFFLLRATAKITHTPIKSLRCIAVSFYGSLFSLLILAPKLNTAVNLAVKAVSAVTIVMAAFGIKSRRRLMLNILAFFAVNFIFAGAVYAVYSWLKPEFIHFNNTYFYIDFSLVILVITTAALYFLVCGVRFFLDRTPDNADCYKIIIRYKNRIVSLDALADTGNSLVDFFTGSPVIICREERLSELIGGKVISGAAGGLPNGFRLIPYSTICENGVIPIFRPDEVVIYNSGNGQRKNVEAMVGVCSAADEAVFNPKLIKI